MAFYREVQKTTFERIHFYQGGPSMVDSFRWDNSGQDADFWFAISEEWQDYRNANT